jgi:NitT/TauT family transport system permease protein
MTVLSLPAPFKPNKVLTDRAWSLLLMIEAGLFVGLWMCGGAFSIPGPIAVLQALGTLITHDGLLYDLIMVSFRVNVEAIALSTMITLALAWSTTVPVMRPPVAVLVLTRFVSMTGLMTPFMLAFGGGHGLKVALLTFGISVFFVTSMAAVVAEIPRSDWDQARSLRMRPVRAIREIVVLGRADQAFEALRQNAAMGWMMLTMVEGIVRSEGGIGTLLLNSARYRQFDAVFAVQFVLFLVGFGQDRLIVAIKNVLCPHVKLATERQ